MKIGDDIHILLKLREQSERVALEDAVRRQQHLRKAERSSEAAERASNAYLAEFRVTEQKLTSPLIGRTTSANALARLQTELDSMQVQTERLKGEAAAARDAVSDSKQLCAAAGERFRLRQRDVLKLELLARRVDHRRSLQGRAIDEATGEDLAAMRHTSSPAGRG